MFKNNLLSCLFNFLSVFFCAFFCNKIVCAQTVKVNVNKSAILIGEPITYILTIPHSSTEIVNVNNLDTLKHFEIIEQKGIDTLDANGLNVYIQKINFTSFDSGTHFFPPLRYNINAVENKTDSFKIEVGYMALDKNETYRDVKKIVEVNYFNWWYIIIGSSILFALLLIIFIYKRINNKKIIFNASTNANAYKNAIAALLKLQTDNNTKLIEEKLYHTQLANIFKTYCSAVLQQNLFVSTTTEVLSTLKIYALNKSNTNAAGEALNTGDASKFAKYIPTTTESETAWLYIKNTIAAIHQLQNNINTK